MDECVSAYVRAHGTMGARDREHGESTHAWANNPCKRGGVGGVRSAISTVLLEHGHTVCRLVIYDTVERVTPRHAELRCTRHISSTVG